MSLLIPSFAFVHLYQMELHAGQLNTLFLSAWIILLLPGVLAWLYFQKQDMNHRGLYLPIMFMNSVNLPFPILLSAFGEEAFPYALVFYLASLLGIFTLGSLIVAEKKGFFQLFKEPVIYAIAIAMWMNLGEVDVPEILIQPLSLLESATIPIVLLVLGMQLSRVKIRQWKLPLLAGIFRLGGGLLAAVLCIWLFKLEGLPQKVVLLEAVMPSAVIGALVAEKYQADPELVASTVALSTFASIFIIPLVLYYIT
ncbi:MAG: AEC family transporter [Candidatus Nitronauta litoralis]|uniref:AEC family transporter n=1 Tax=Candidatus Nitronauta litoralis TaxID=2705533 RepID=A0A7T0BXW0_9BACT|nr:MAG: AEC family transporter [Candidatus Nitronauta litoralis]